MSRNLQRAASAVLSQLCELSESPPTSEIARKLVRDAVLDFPDIRVDLVVEPQRCDASPHYEAVVEGPDSSVMVASYADDGTPWVLRDVHRWSESDLLRVNNCVMTMRDAMALLELVWDEHEVFRRFVDACLLKEELDRSPIQPDDGEVQAALDAFRWERGLTSADAMLRWMGERGLTHEVLDEVAVQMATTNALRERVAAERMDELLRDRSVEFRIADVCIVRVVDMRTGEQLKEAMGAGDEPFPVAVQRVLEEGDALGAQITEVSSRAVSCRDAPAASWRDEVFASDEGQRLLGPFAREPLGAELVYVRRLRTPEAGTDRDEALVAAAFEQWLRERRQTARIEWNWGGVDLMDPFPNAD